MLTLPSIPGPDVLAFAVISAVAAWSVLRLQRRWRPQPSLRAGCYVMVGLICAAAEVGAAYAGERERDRIAEMMLTFVPTYAQEMEALGIDRISLDTDVDDPDYLRLIAAEKRWLEANHSANDIYVFCRDGEGRTRLLVDSETDYNRDGDYDDDREERTELGELYESEDPELPRAFAGETIFELDPVTDRWGTWVSAFGPIRDRDGQVIAVLGIDYDAAALYDAVGRRRLTVFGVAAFLQLLVLAATSFVALAMFDAVRHRAANQLLEMHARALARINGELEVKGDALARANAAATAATAAKSEFLANMSHEIRTPMTAILGFTDELLEDDVDEGTRRAHLETIRRSGTHLLTILSDVLDLSKIEANRMELRNTAFALRTVCDEVVQLLRVRADKKGIELSCRYGDGVPTVMFGDPTRLRQVLFNLIGNAVKFTDRGRVTVTVEVQGADESARVTLAVEDTGIGMDASELDTLFEPFRQLDSSVRRNHGGAGLGLSISRRLARMMGGDIEVESKTGRGSRFTLTIPVGPRFAAGTAGEVGATSTAASDKPPRLRGRVLYVEDSPDNRQLIGLMLRRFGVVVEFAENGAEAIRCLTDVGSIPPDLVLMDMMMPVLDGYEATRRLREMGYLGPIVALTAHAMDSERERCLGCGCDDFITKPIQRAQFLRAIGRWLAVAEPAGAVAQT